jgi:hypothetical protein
MPVSTTLAPKALNRLAAKSVVLVGSCKKVGVCSTAIRSKGVLSAAALAMAS